jgi:hypothetical protein
MRLSKQNPRVYPGSIKTDSPNEYKSSGGPCPVAVRAARRVFGRLVSRTIGLQGSEGPSEPADRGGPYDSVSRAPRACSSGNNIHWLYFSAYRLFIFSALSKRLRPFLGYAVFIHFEQRLAVTR